MRIGIDGRYIADHFPGIGRYTYNLAAKLPELAPDTDFVLFHNPRLLNTRYDLERMALNPNLRLLPVDVPTRSLKEQYQLRSLARAFSLDLLHSPYYIMPYWQHCPSVVTMYDLIPMIYPQDLPHRWTAWVFRAAASLAIRRANHTIAISECTKRDLIRLFGASEDKITVTHLAADERFRPLDSQQWKNTVRAYGLPERYILYLGINKPHKNLAFLLQVFKEIRTEAKLVLAGKEDPRYPQVREEARRLRLGDRVVFLGDIPEHDLPMIYNGAQVFVFPSLYEGFGLPVLEAMACGTPVVCSNSSSFPEIVGDAAVTVDPQDRVGWVTALTELLESEELRAELRTKGLEQANKLNWQKAARETLDVYQSVLSR
ncbi:MAG TPA: glycosyltransferase family 1 protein [Anaerolineae bacterium]|nr:glycosyltransferase family 1 protein [Anaerolineae bacterium]